MKKLKILGFCLLVALPFTGQAQGGSVPSASNSVRNFVQAFYDWYAPKAAKSGAGRTWDTALNKKANCFSTALRHQLRADSDEQAKVAGEIVGLDFDPFLDSQDPDRYYRVGKVASKDRTYLVEVHRVVSDKVEQQRTVTAEVAGKAGQWYFINFHYPNGPTLLDVLKSLQKSRHKTNP